MASPPSPPTFFDTLEARARAADSLLCVGLDPHEVDLKGDVTGAGAFAFCKRLIEATKDVAAAYKPNQAFFEQLGPDGIAALERVIKELVPAGTPVVLDAKRGDISSTAQAYAKAAFGAMAAHSVTVNPYMGADSVDPFTADASRGAWVLCKTSNPSSADLQTRQVAAADADGGDSDGEGEALFEAVAGLASETWNARGNVGLVVGATDVDALARVRARAPRLWILAPGVGAQGGDLAAACAAALRDDGMGVLFPVSRGISRAADPGAAARQLRDAINEARAAREAAALDARIAARNAKETVRRKSVQAIAALADPEYDSDAEDVDEAAADDAHGAGARARELAALDAQIRARNANEVVRRKSVQAIAALADPEYDSDEEDVDEGLGRGMHHAASAAAAGGGGGEGAGAGAGAGGAGGMAAHERAFFELAVHHGVLRFGEFTLKSGRVSPYFFNAGLFDSGGAIARLGEHYAAAVVASGIAFDVIFGPAYKGITLAAAVAAALYQRHGRDVPFAYNRKEAKDHGEGGVLVGAPVAGRRVLVVDDVITAGTAIRQAVGLLGGAGATVAGVVVALDRQEVAGGPEPPAGARVSAIQAVQKELGVPVAHIGDLNGLLRFLEGGSGGGAGQDAAVLERVRKYRATYGVV